MRTGLFFFFPLICGMSCLYLLQVITSSSGSFLFQQEVKALNRVGILPCCDSNCHSQGGIFCPLHTNWVSSKRRFACAEAIPADKFLASKQIWGTSCSELPLYSSGLINQVSLLQVFVRLEPLNTFSSLMQPLGSKSIKVGANGKRHPVCFRKSAVC